MARYPTFEEYAKRGNYKDGIKRCDDLLKKSPNDVQLLTVKLQLCYASKGNADPILEQLLSVQPPIRDLRELVTIEEAIIDSQKDVFPQPKTAGPILAKFWDNAFKAFTSTDYKVDLQSVRFSRAIVDNRLIDAQQALIQLKALQPKNRVFYMAHAAVTQLLSTSKEDMQSRLALSLARKAVTENFDEDKYLDCRVPGQIFALQSSQKDIDGIADRRFKESKQVYKALHANNTTAINGVSGTAISASPTKVVPTERLQAEVQALKEQFATLIESSAAFEAVSAFATKSMRLFHTATTLVPDGKARALADACFLCVSALVRMFELTNELRYLPWAAFHAEMLLKQNTNIHEARLILVYLYMRLGLGSLALRMFDSLSVKEIQHDTVGHTLFTRLSFTHPQSTALNKKDSIDPSKRTAHALTVYTRHEEKLAETEAGALSHGQTGMILDIEELRHSLRSSLTKRITLLEHRRIGRLLNDSSGGDDLTQLTPRVAANWLDFTDNRDFMETFDYGYNVERVLHARGGGLPGKHWLLSTLAADVAWCSANGLTAPVNDHETLIQELENIALDLDRLQIAEGGPASSLGLSDAEFLAGGVAFQILKLYRDLNADSDGAVAAVREALKAVERLNVSGLLNTNDIFSEHLQDHYTYIDILRIVVKTNSVGGKPTQSLSEELRKLQETARDYFNAIQKRARDQMEKIDAEKIKTYMAQNNDLQEAVKSFGDAEVDGFCKSVAASAWEGWKGLTEIRLG